MTLTRVLGAVCLAAVLSATAVWGVGTPHKISFQGKATNASGNPVPDGSYPVQFHLYDHPTAGTDRWSEIFPMVTTSGGLFTYLLGSSTPIPDNLFADYDSLYLEVIFNGVILSPRTPIVSVGYALRVNTVDGASGGTIWSTDYYGVTVNSSGASAEAAIAGNIGVAKPTAASAIVGSALNTGTGAASGGYFYSQTAGGGEAQGVSAGADVVFGNAKAYGVYAESKNRASGDAYGGMFVADSAGTGDHCGIIGYGYGTGGSGATGGDFYGYGDFTSYGVRAFSTSDNGTASGASFLARSSGSDTYDNVTGMFANAFSTGAFGGTSYGGHFLNEVTTGQNAYGVYALSQDLGSGYSSFGVYGLTEPLGTGSSAGGYFKSDSTGTGTSYGCRGVGNARSIAAAYGVTGQAASQGTGVVYGGYFEAINAGSGGKYGIYAKAPTTGYAGYFSGNLRVTGNQTVDGTKSAAVEVAPEEYRLVYSQESPECWFEDFGEGQLVHGQVHINLDPRFLQTVTIDAQHPMKVFIQLNDPDCNGTAVVRGTDGFDVVELRNGKGSAAFSYRVVAKRRGYEDLRLARLPGLTTEQVEAQTQSDRQEDRAVEETLRQDALRQLEQSSELKQRRIETAGPAGE